ncbi:hypothetical protein B0E49_03110 [Polaromonas sp. C04]|nr:hypothetical protein B0E49_03110 [Polaromonas sp. C04]
MSGVECAKTIGVKASTVSEWMNHNPQFSGALASLRDQINSASIERLQACVGVAVDEVQRIITSGKSEAVRLRAAEFVITNFAVPNTTASAPDGDVFGKRMNMAMILEGLGVGHGR